MLLHVDWKNVQVYFRAIKLVIINKNVSLKSPYSGKLRHFRVGSNIVPKKSQESAPYLSMKASFFCEIGIFGQIVPDI